MRPVLITTDTIHHAYYVRELTRRYKNLRVVAETATLAPPFPTAHAFEAERDAREQEFWFDGRPGLIADFAEVVSLPSVNTPEALAAVKSMKPDIVLVFGAGRLRQEAIAALPPGRTINAHGGDPEEYRGLDSHLWAIYHRDFAALVATLHQIAPALDTGDIVGQAPVPVAAGMALSDLRRANTETLLALSLDALLTFERSGSVRSTAQRRRGRYYSFMPAVLKAECLDKFAAHTRNLL